MVVLYEQPVRLVISSQSGDAVKATNLPPNHAWPLASDQEWRPLYFFNLYRTTLAGLFLVLVFWGVAPRTLGQVDTALFRNTALFYFAFSIFSSLTIHRRRPDFDLQIVLQVMVDVIAISLLMHASGGIKSGFGMLLLVAVAGGSILAASRVALLFAAMASLILLSEQLYIGLAVHLPVGNYAQAGILGALCFAVAHVAQRLAVRVRASEALAARREQDLAKLAQLNEHIIQRMQAGILALGPRGRVRLLNESARGFLALSGEVEGRALPELCPDLQTLLQKWRNGDGWNSHLFHAEGMAVQVMASFASLGEPAGAGVLVFLEDATAITRRAQQLKLASLGRLTASIAHEIRNPLGAISHAGQLLQEAPELASNDRRLVEIIRDNCQRMNGIIENVLSLSRQRPAVAENLAVDTWLDEFCDEVVANHGIKKGCISVDIQSVSTALRFDPSQLRQVVWNLVENGIHHGGAGAKIKISVFPLAETGRACLEVGDNGPGISAADRERIFEPFYTTQGSGTGLGLFIARELCVTNQASLEHIPEAHGCRFRITFSDPRRQEVPLA